MTTARSRPAATDPPKHIPPVKRWFALCASEPGIRASLADMRGFIAASGLGADACGTAEIVLAEALNNIAEHAYAASGTGAIHVALTVLEGHLLMEIVDEGAALPGLTPPPCKQPCLDASDLPEGGFGWFLIRSLTESLRYERKGGTNHLQLRIACPRGGADADRADM